MTESAGEIKALEKYHDSVILAVFLEPENSIDPSQVWEWRIGEKVKGIGNEPKP